jgi:hypothetical protein
MKDFEARKKMWLILGRIFSDLAQLDMIWIFSTDDMYEINKLPDGTGSLGCIGVVKDIEP